MSNAQSSPSSMPALLELRLGLAERRMPNCRLQYEGSVTQATMTQVHVLKTFMNDDTDPSKVSSGPNKRWLPRCSVVPWLWAETTLMLAALWRLDCSLDLHDPEPIAKSVGGALYDSTSAGRINVAGAVRLCIASLPATSARRRWPRTAFFASLVRPRSSTYSYSICPMCSFPLQPLRSGCVGFVIDSSRSALARECLR